MKPGQRSAGHPVDIASGAMFMAHEDVSIIGKIDLVWERQYSTALLADSPSTPLGPGWTSRYFATLSGGPGEYYFGTPEGGTEVFADPEGVVHSGGTVRNPGTFRELFRRGDEYVVERWNVETQETVRFVFLRGWPGEVWPLDRVEDATGQALLMLRDGNGRLAAIQQRLEGRRIEVGYNDLGRIESISFPLPDGSRQVLARYGYDTAGRLSVAADARGYADHYEYDDEDRIVREIHKDGGVFTFQYDDRGRCVRTSGIDGYDEKILRYRSEIGWTEVTNSRGYTRRYQWLASGQVVTEIDALGGVERTEYDEHGRIVSRTSALGAREEYEYDERGNRSRITNALGQSTRIVYTDSHQIAEVTTPAGHTLYREYDEHNRMVASVDSEGNRYSLSFDHQGNLVEVTDPLGRKLRQSFNAQGVRETLTDWEGNVTRYTADVFGRVTEIVDPRGNRKRLHYDALSNLIRVDYPDGTTNAFHYDAGRNLSRVDDRNGETTRYRYGPCKRLLERVDPLGGTMRFGWGSEPGNLETISNAKGEVYTYRYNAVGLVAAEIGFDGREIAFEYNLAGDRTASVNGLGERTGYERDIGGRLVRELLPDGSETAYSYDAAGFLEEVRNADSQIRLERDSLGRILREVQNGHVIERQYDPTGMVVRLETDLALSVDYGFDGNCQLSRFQVAGQPAVVLHRDACGAEFRRDLPGGTTMMQRHDEMGRLVEQAVSSRTAGTLRRSYRYERTQLVEVRDQEDAATYQYDPVRRVVLAVRERGGSEHFRYDATDNITWAARGGDADTLLYGDGDRLQVLDETTYDHDAQGRLVRKVEHGPDGAAREWRYEWDALDQLRAVTNPDGDTWRYAYDPFGRRIEKRGPDGESHRFVWDIDHVLHELRDGELSASWIFDPHSLSPLCKLEGEEIYPIVTDHLGTPREVLDRSGRIVWQAEHFVWGGIREERIAEVDCPVRFQGQWYDPESGLHYNRYRYYDPGAGRFISQDPTRLRGAINLYAYVFDPNQWIDPLGLVINTTADRTHVTYVGSKGGQPYVGYASMPGNQSGDDVLRYRYSSGFGAEGLDGAPNVVYRGYGQDLESSQAAKATARGLEQRHFEQNGGLEGTANRQNPVGENNANRDAYLEAADEHLARQQGSEDGCSG